MEADRKEKYHGSQARGDLPIEEVQIALHGVNNCFSTYPRIKERREHRWNIYELWPIWSEENILRL